ncbi:hypothetical protein JYQ33_02915 [Curtobacterium flaccumfaciens pv. flaccumfaciens]|nr:hypothetical protein [Curtobacterium flaccumfaciens pv. flaccumfaciens]
MAPHDLRHTTAPLAISSGANVKAVQRMLGTASAAMTLEAYVDLFDDDLTALADVLDDQRTQRMCSICGALPLPETAEAPPSRVFVRIGRASRVRIVNESSKSPAQTLLAGQRDVRVSTPVGVDLAQTLPGTSVLPKRATVGFRAEFLARLASRAAPWSATPELPPSLGRRVSPSPGLPWWVARVPRLMMLRRAFVQSESIE